MSDVSPMNTADKVQRTGDNWIGERAHDGAKWVVDVWRDWDINPLSSKTFCFVRNEGRALKRLVSLQHFARLSLAKNPRETRPSKLCGEE